MECRIWKGHYLVSFFNGYVNFLPRLDVSFLGVRLQKKALKRDYKANLKYKYKELVYLPFDTLSSQVSLTHTQFRQPYSTTGLKY